MPRCHDTSASSSFFLFVVGEAGSPLWCHLRSERLHDYLSISDDKRVGCEFIVVIPCFSTPNQVGIIALEDCRAHRLRCCACSLNFCDSSKRSPCWDRPE